VRVTLAAPTVKGLQHKYPDPRRSIFIELFHLHLYVVMPFSTPPENKRVIKTQGLQAHLENTIYIEDSMDPVYCAKAKILNDASQEIGMGKYQVCLVCVYPP